MSDELVDVSEIADRMVGLPVYKAWRGVGTMMNLDIGAWDNAKNRSDITLWVKDAVWRLDADDLYVANNFSCSHETIDAALGGLTGLAVAGVEVSALGVVVIDFKPSRLTVFPVHGRRDNWWLRATGWSATSGPSGRFSVEKVDE